MRARWRDPSFVEQRGAAVDDDSLARQVGGCWASKKREDRRDFIGGAVSAERYEAMVGGESGRVRVS